MVPRGGAMGQTEQNAYGNHDNPVSSSHQTVTLNCSGNQETHQIVTQPIEMCGQGKENQASN